MAHSTSAKISEYLMPGTLARSANGCNSSAAVLSEKIMQSPNPPDDTSWWDELIGGLTQKPMPPPPTPQPPPVDQSAWEKIGRAGQDQRFVGFRSRPGAHHF